VSPKNLALVLQGEIVWVQEEAGSNDLAVDDDFV
jgi:hypothetical protein